MQLQRRTSSFVSTISFRSATPRRPDWLAVFVLHVVLSVNVSVGPWHGMPCLQLLSFSNKIARACLTTAAPFTLPSCPAFSIPCSSYNLLTTVNHHLSAAFRPGLQAHCRRFAASVALSDAVTTSLKPSSVHWLSHISLNSTDPSTMSDLSHNMQFSTHPIAKFTPPLVRPPGQLRLPKALH